MGSLLSKQFGMHLMIVALLIFAGCWIVAAALAAIVILMLVR